VLEFLKGKNKAILGIDISSHSVKILEISGNDEQHIVKAFAKEEFPVDIPEENAFVDSDIIAQSIRKLISQYKISTKTAALAVPDSAVISKTIQMNDGLSDSELEELVILEADKYIPYAIDEINIDFEIQGHSAKNSAMLDVLIVASRAENVSKRVEAVTKAGLTAKIVDVESFAVERVVQLINKDLPAEGQDKIIAVIDIGAKYTHLFVLEGMKIIFTREEVFGGDQIIHGISEHYEVGFEEARRMYQNKQLPEDFTTAIREPFIENLLVQIKRTLQFFYSTSHHTYVDHVLLAGGVARMEDLLERIEKDIGITASVTDPFKYMDISPTIDTEALHEHAPSLMIACGLALRHIE